MPAWDNVKRSRPLQTWSGEVVYKREKHEWTMSDLMRVAAHVKITPTGNTTWVKIVKFIRDLTIRMIDEILDNLWFLPDDASKVAYDFMYKAIYKLLGFQPLPDSGDIEKSKELIRFIAARANIKVDIKE